MKINLYLPIISFLAFLCVPAAQAQVTVVKQDGALIYLDTSEYNRRVSVGDSFKIILSQEKLTNPKTGKELGLINHYSPSGKIIEVQDLYAIGEMPTKNTYTIGQEAVLESTTNPVNTAITTQTEKTPLAVPVSSRKVTVYTAMEREIISATEADFTAFPGQEIMTVDTKGLLVLYRTEGNTLQELATHKLTVGQKPITLSAQDLMQSGHAQLFVTVYKEQEQKINTLVFDMQDTAFKQVAVLPYFVKELGCGEEKTLYGQKPFIRGNTPGDIHVLTYHNGQFALAKEALPTRGNWLTGIAEYAIQNNDTENFVYTAKNGRLKMKLANGKFIDSPALFATAPNRVKYKQAIISFYPSLQVYGPKGRATLAGIENTSKLGLLSEQFGQYHGGKLHFLTYENGALQVQETLELQGFAYDTACTNHGILVPQVMSSGQTVLTEIYR